MKKTSIFVCLIFMAATSFLLVSCGGGSNSNEANKQPAPNSSSAKVVHNIKTADQWLEYCYGEPNIHRCLTEFDEIDLNSKCRIFDGMTKIVAHFSDGEVKMIEKVDAYVYIFIYMEKYPNGKELENELKRRGSFATWDAHYAGELGGDRVDAVMMRYISE